MLRSINSLLILILCLTQNSHAPSASGNLKSTVNCHQTNYMLEDFDSGVTESIAPNHSNRIVLLKDGSFQIQRVRTVIDVIQLDNLSSNIDVTWAPDSQKFSITYSDGGAMGAFHAHLYELNTNGVVELTKPVDVAFADFKARFYCKERGNNIRVSGWTLDSAKVLIVTGVYPTGDCGKNFGRLGAYLMDLKGNIIRRYGEKEAEIVQSSCEKSGYVHLPLD